MKVKDLIEELSKFPEDMNILSIEIEDWQCHASWNEVDYQRIYYDNEGATILYIKNYD